MIILLDTFHHGYQNSNNMEWNLKHQVTDFYNFFLKKSAIPVYDEENNGITGLLLFSYSYKRKIQDTQGVSLTYFG